jgi:hypothetical protein
LLHELGHSIVGEDEDSAEQWAQNYISSSHRAKGVRTSVAKGASYFADCPRDDKGHCEESGKGDRRGAQSDAHPGAALHSAVKVKKTGQRAFEGKPVPVKTKLTKQETGRVGEAVVLAYLKDVLGRKDARPMNKKKTNFPVDLIEDHAPTEVKAGLASNGADAQKWRLTFSKESKAEKAWYEKATPEERAAWNATKQERIHERKEAVLAELQARTGKKAKPRTMTVIINPDTRTADVYVFNGWHDILRWRSEEAEAAYRGSVVYDHS